MDSDDICREIVAPIQQKQFGTIRAFENFHRAGMPAPARSAG